MVRGGGSGDRPEPACSRGSPGGNPESGPDSARIARPVLELGAVKVEDPGHKALWHLFSVRSGPDHSSVVPLSPCHGKKLEHWDWIFKGSVGLCSPLKEVVVLKIQHILEGAGEELALPRAEW